MRIQFPLIPVIINVIIEWRSEPSERWRMSFGASLLLVVLAAFVILPWASDRREACLLRLKYHAVQERIFENKIAQYERAIQEARRANRPAPPNATRAIAEYRPDAMYHEDQKARFQRALSRPWVSIVPDPRSMRSDEEISGSIRAWEKRHGPLR